jgi:hypothetical protein
MEMVCSNHDLNTLVNTISHYVLLIEHSTSTPRLVFVDTITPLSSLLRHVFVHAPTLQQNKSLVSSQYFKVSVCFTCRPCAYTRGFLFFFSFLKIDTHDIVEEVWQTVSTAIYGPKPNKAYATLDILLYLISNFHKSIFKHATKD